MGPAFQKDLKNLSYLSISEYQGCGVFTDFWSVLSSIILENYFLGIYKLSFTKNEKGKQKCHPHSSSSTQRVFEEWFMRSFIFKWMDNFMYEELMKQDQS